MSVNQIRDVIRLPCVLIPMVPIFAHANQDSDGTLIDLLIVNIVFVVSLVTSVLTVKGRNITLLLLHNK